MERPYQPGSQLTDHRNIKIRGGFDQGNFILQAGSDVFVVRLVFSGVAGLLAFEIDHVFLNVCLVDVVRGHPDCLRQ